MALDPTHPQDQDSSRRRRGSAIAFVAVVLFSLSLPMAKVALRGFDVITVSVGRSAIAGALALLIVLIRRTPAPPRTLYRAILLTAAGGIIGFPIFTTAALQSTTSAHAAIVIALLPIVTAVIAVRLTHERQVLAFWIAAASGTGIVVLYAFIRSGEAGGSLTADLLLLAAVGCASYGYVEGAVLTHAIPGWQVTSWTLVAMLPLTMPITAASLWLHRATLDPTPATTGALLYLAFIVAYLAYMLWYRGLGDAGVTRGSQVQNLQPLLTVCASAVILGEAIPAGTWVTAGLVLVAVVITQRTRTAGSPS